MSVKKPRRTTFKQLLKAAKKTAKGLNRKWRVDGGGTIRLYRHIYYATDSNYYCPLTAAAFTLTGSKFYPSEWRFAAKLIGYIGNPSKVVAAADNSTLSLRPRERWMRAQMKKELL
ncbi:MAG: hypothetical protein MN733_07860 [Nitrososphaera sp.]|nr:hypothetical protein [Nitrososphaera sp.]